MLLSNQSFSRSIHRDRFPARMLPRKLNVPQFSRGWLLSCALLCTVLPAGATFEVRGGEVCSIRDALEFPSHGCAPLGPAPVIEVDSAAVAACCRLLPGKPDC